MKNTRDSLIGYEYHVLIFKYNKILFLHLMNTLDSSFARRIVLENSNRNIRAT